MSGFEITCINKDQRGAMVRLGGAGWSMQVHDAIVKLISHQLRLYIRVDDTFFDVGVRGDGFAAYLVLEPEGFALNELSSVASC